MVRELDAEFLEQAESEANKPITLYEVNIVEAGTVASGGEAPSAQVATVVRLAQYDSDVVFGGATYTAYPAMRSTISNNNSGKIVGITITVGNISREWSAYIANYDIRGNLVRVRLVFSDTISDSDAYLDDVFYIDTYSANATSVTISCKSKLDIMDAVVPNRDFSRETCPWVYKGDSGECKYAGTLATCDRSLDGKNGCRAHGNAINYGGFPGIPSRDTTVGA